MAVGAAEEIILRIIGDSKSAEDALKRVQRAWSQIGQQLKNAKGPLNEAAVQMERNRQKAKALEERLNKTAQAGKALGVVFGGLAAAGAKIIQSTAQVAMRNEVLAVSLYAVGEQAGYDRQELDALTDQVKSLGITTSNSRLSITRMIQSQLDLSKATDLARTAQNLAVIAGEGSSKAYDDIMQAVTSLNPRMLRNYGIVATTGQILGDLADSTDATAKKQRMLDFVLAEGAKVAGVYESAMGVVGKKITSFPRYIEELKATFGKHFLPIIGEGVDILATLLKAFQKLPDGVQHMLAMMVLLVTVISTVIATMGGLGVALPHLIAGFTAVKVAVAPLLPSLLPIIAVIGALIAVGALLAKAWQGNWGGIQGAVQGAMASIKPHIDRLIGLVRLWGSHFALQAKRIWNSVVNLIEPIFRRLGNLANALAGTNWGSLFNTLSDALNVAGNLISGFLDTINRLLRGEGTRAFSSLESAAIDGLTMVALVFDKYIKKALAWGWNLIVQVANGISRAAQAVLVKVMRFVGNIIGRFLAPGSPPKEGPLSNIVKWGKGVMETFVRAFKTADFGLMREALSPIQSALESALQAGDIDEIEFGEIFGTVRGQVAELIAGFRETGEVSEETLGKIAETLGEGSEEYVKLLRLQLEHQKALGKLAAVEEEVAAAEAKGFIPAKLKKRLQAAQDEVGSAQEALEWQKEYLAVQQENINLQLRMVEALERLSEVMDKASGDAAGAGAGDVGAGAGAGVGAGDGLMDSLGDLGGATGGLDALQAKLGEMSPEFESMRTKVVGWVTSVKEWIALPFTDKLMTVAQKLREITGIDFPGFLQRAQDILAEIDEKGLLEVIKEWVQKGVDYIDDNWKDWAKNISDFMRDMFAQAVELLLEKVADAKEQLSDWYGRIMTQFYSWLDSKKQEWAGALHEKITQVVARFVELITIDIPTHARSLFTWFTGIISDWFAFLVADIGKHAQTLRDWFQDILDGWIALLNITTSDRADDLKAFMKRVIETFVAQVREKAAGWVDGLKSVGRRMVEKIKSGLTEAWDMVTFLGDKLSTMATSLINGNYLSALTAIGQAIIDKMKAGITAGWRAFVNWLASKITGISWPWGGGGDDDSGGEEFGAGGFQFPTVPFGGAGTALTSLGAGQSASNASVIVNQFFEGGLNFPNVRSGRDAIGVRREMSDKAREAAMLARAYVPV